MPSPYSYQSGTGGGGSASGSGGINYASVLFDGTSLNGINTYNDGSVAVPVDGTGGTVTGLSTTLNSTVPLRSPTNQRFSKDAANRQGEGWSWDFVAAPADYLNSKQVFVSFRYRVSSNYVAGDLRVFLYNKDTGATPVAIQTTASDNGGIPSITGSYLMTGSFDLANADNDYRLIFHITSTNASAWDFDIIDWTVTPSSFIPGAIITPALQYTPTFAGLVASPQSIFWNRVGDYLHITGRFDASSVSGSDLTTSLPAGFTIQSFASTKVVGKWWRSQAGSNTAKEGTILALPGLTYLNWGNGEYATNTSPLNVQPANTIIANTDSVSFDCWVPIVGAASAAISTNPNVLNLVRVIAQNTGTTTPSGSEQDIAFGTILTNTHNAFNGTMFTAPKSAFYQFNSRITINLTGGSGALLYAGVYTAANVQLAQSGNTTKPGISSNYGITGNPVIYLTANQQVKLRFFQNDGSTSTFLSGNNTSLEIVELPDFQVFSTFAQNRVTFSANTSTTSASTSTPFVFTVEIDDSANAYNNATGVFTVPVGEGGLYQFGWTVYTGSGTNSYGQLYKNGSNTNMPQATQGTTASVGIGLALLPLVPGDTIEIRPTGAATATGGSQLNTFNGFRVR